MPVELPTLGVFSSGRPSTKYVWRARPPCAAISGPAADLIVHDEALAGKPLGVKIEVSQKDESALHLVYNAITSQCHKQSTPYPVNAITNQRHNQSMPHQINDITSQCRNQSTP